MTTTIIVIAILVIIGSISWVRPSKRDGQLSRLRAIAHEMKWRVEMRYDKTKGEWYTIYRYQQPDDIEFKHWHWLQRYQSDMRKIPDDAKVIIKELFWDEARFYEIHTIPRGIELHWHEFGSPEQLKNRLDGLIKCLNSTINSNQ